MGKQDQAWHRNWTAPRTQETFKFVSWLVELHARRTSSPVRDPLPLLDEVAIAVVLVKPPVVTVTVHCGVAMFHLDGDESPGSQENMINLTATVLVASQQRPVVTENTAELCRDYLLACHSGRENLFTVSGPAGAYGRSRNAPLLLRQAEDASQPCPPAMLRASLIPPITHLLNALAMLHK